MIIRMDFGKSTTQPQPSQDTTYDAQIIEVKCTEAEASPWSACKAVEAYVNTHSYILPENQSDEQFFDRQSVLLEPSLYGSMHIIMPGDIDAQKIIKGLKEESLVNLECSLSGGSPRSGFTEDQTFKSISHG